MRTATGALEILNSVHDFWAAPGRLLLNISLTDVGILVAVLNILENIVKSTHLVNFRVRECVCSGKGSRLAVSTNMHMAYEAEIEQLKQKTSERSCNTGLFAGSFGRALSKIEKVANVTAVL